MSSLSINNVATNNVEEPNEQGTSPWITRALGAGMVITMLIAYVLEQSNGDNRITAAVAVFGVIAVGFGSLLVLSDSRAGISVFILCACVSPRTEGNLRMEDMLLPAILLVWFGRVSRGDTFRLRTPVTVPLCIVAVTMILSWIWGQAHGTNANPVEGLLISCKRIEYGLLFVFALNSVRTQHECRTLFRVFLWGAVLAAVISLGSANTDVRVGDTRATGLDLENYNTLAGFMVIAASLALAGACQYRGKTRIAYGLIAILMMSTLLKTYSREGYFMLGVSVGVLGLIRYRVLIPIVLVMVIFSQWILPDTIVDKVNEAMTNLQNYQTDSAGSNSFTARVGGWTNRWTMVVAQPVFGNGPGSAPLHIDNEYLLRQIESGVIGLSAFLYLVYALGRYLVICVQRMRGTENEAFAYGLIAAYTSVVVQGTVSAAWSTIRTMEPFWILTGAVGGLVMHQNFINGKTDDSAEAVIDGD